jgi:hypothetical protein
MGQEGKMDRIQISKAQEEFCGSVKVGEYVAWWVSHDKTSRIRAVIRSYPTLEKCEKEARELLINPFISPKVLKKLNEEGDFEYKKIIVD